MKKRDPHDLLKAPYRKIYVSEKDNKYLKDVLAKILRMQRRIGECVPAVERLLERVVKLDEYNNETWEYIEIIADRTVGIDTERCFWCGKCAEKNDPKRKVKLVKTCNPEGCEVKHYHYACSECDNEWITPQWPVMGD